MAVSRKDSRVDIRLSAEHKENLLRAATSLGLSLSDFMVLKSMEAADEVLRRSLKLTPRDLDVLMNALDREQEPSGALLRAVEKYRAHDATTE